MLQKCSIWNVASIFFEEPTKEHYLIEISRKTKLAHTSVKIHIKKLKELQIITENIKKLGTRNFSYYKANLTNSEFKNNKKIHNLAKLQESKLILRLKDKFMPKTIVLFGSYQKGEDIEDSDIDLFLECKEEKIDLKKYNIRFHRNIQLHFKENFKKYSKELKNNIINGIIVDGYLEAF